MSEDQRPTILYVDEQSDERDNFFTDAYDSGLFSEIIVMHPETSLANMLNEVMVHDFDALITDFNLTDEAYVEYNGEDLINRYLSIKKDFPCFIRTSFEDDALKISVDVNRIYSKDVKTDDHSGAPLFKRVQLQIERHRRLIDTWRQEFEELLQISPDDLNASQVDRIVELDSKIEAYFGEDAKISVDVKKQLFKQRDDLIEETERLLSDIKKKIG